MQEEISDEIGAVIEAWCGRERNTYGPGKGLKNLWVESGRLGADYQSRGVRRLLDKLGDDPQLKQKAEQSGITEGDFAGGIQTILQLQQRLA
jgi:hypothetical protein